MKLLKRESYLAILDKIIPLLMYPNAWIRKEIKNYISILLNNY